MSTEINKSTILVSGATGLIAGNLIKKLLTDNDEITIIAMIRSEEKAQRVFGKFFGDSRLVLLRCNDISESLDIKEKVDYIIHCANPTSSRFFVNNPVETMQTAFLGTMNMLQLAVKKKVRGMIYLSTMEVYGTPEKGTKVEESNIGTFNPTNTRNSYPLGKMACENLCYGYSKEYDVPVKIARLTQTFGEGVEYNDGRVFAEFARCAIEKRDIVLKTKGETERCYLSVDDAVEAIVTILLNGQNGEAYTVANEQTYCSIYDMAQLVAKEYGINVVVEEEDISRFGYADTLYMNLDTARLRKLGWKANDNLSDMYKSMIKYMTEYKE